MGNVVAESDFVFIEDREARVGKEVLAEEDFIAVVEIDGCYQNEIIGRAAEAFLKLLESCVVMPELGVVELLLSLMHIIPGVVQYLERTVKLALEKSFTF